MNTTESEVQTSRQMAVVDQNLFALAICHAPEAVRERVEAAAEVVASRLAVTRADVTKAVREVGNDFGFDLSDADVEFATGLLIERHLGEDYIRERIDDHLGEQAEETLRELRFDLAGGGRAR